MTTFIFRLAPLIVLLSLNCFGQGYQLTDLGALTGTNSYAQGINNQQQVVGYWDTTNGTHAFLYNAGAITDLGTLGGLNSYALNINSAGQIVGFSQTPDGVGAFLYGSGGMTNLGTLGGLDSYGFGINDTADIVGCIETTNGFQAILLSNGEVTQLGTLGGTNSFAYSVNLTRQVAGTSLTADNVSPNAFLWQDNLLTNLNDLLPLGSGWQLQEARAINNAGQIVGWGLLDSVKHAFLFSSNTIIDLGILPGGTNSYALGLNNSNQVVGASTISNGVLHGFLWDNGTLKDLNNSLPTNSGWELREATAINDQGQIAGWGTNQGSESAFLMTPSPLPSSSSLQLWFRADEGVITDTNGNVSQWLDQSGNGNHASQTVTAAEPVLATNAINGEPVVRFNGTSDFLSFPAVNTTNFTIFIVYRMTGHQAWAGPLENRAAGLYGFELGSGSADTSVYEPELVESFGSQELVDETTGVGLSLPLGPVLQEWTSDKRFFQDGLEQAVLNGATGWDVSGGRLGYAWSYMAGDIAEVLVYNTVLSDTDRQGVENYLNGKYAVLSAPPAPVISPPGGTYPGSVTVTLSTPALGTQLYYTTDGSQPTTNSTLYAVPFNLSSNATVTAVSYLNGMASATTNADFAVTAGSAPTAAAGLAFWFRADVGVITDGSGNVSQWLDESGNGNHASQTVAAAEPVLATNAINGEPVVRFNGTSDCLSFPAVNTTNFTVFIVYRMTGHQAWAGPLENRTAGLYGFEVASGSADTSVYEPELVESLGSQELADITTGVATSLPLGPVLQEWTSGERFFQDGLEQTVVNGATGWDVSGGRLGYAWSYMAGDIAEVLVYNMVLSDTDRQGVESYLNGKYAVLTPPPAPVISPDGGTYPGSVTVTLSTPALGTQLYYTTDGSQPTTNSTFYAGPFNLSSNATVTAVSYLNGMASATTNADFAVTTGSAPTAATGLAFWFRADAGVITDGSGNVSQWLDQSGNGIHASQTAATAKPVLATNAINGEPAVRFNGTSDYLGFPAVNTTNFTVFIVYRMTGHQAWAGPLENRAAGLYGFELGSGSADTSVYEPELVESFGSQELADKTTGVGLSLPMGPVLQEWTSDERFFQGGLEQSVINGATGWDVSGGRLGYAWSYMAGDIAEVLVYNTVLSDTDRQDVENYLNGKYAVLSAPPAPVISPPGGTYPGSVTVTLSTPALGTQLYYTTDGSQPTTNSTLYTGAFNLSSNATVTAVSYLNAIGSATTNAEFAVTTGSAPTAATGLAFWFRADEGVITNGNGNVSQWLDESGNGNHASQTTMAAEPLLATNAINGEPVIRFNGTSDYLSFPAVNTTNFTIFIVYRMTGHQAWAGPLENRAAGLYGFELGSASADTSVYEPELVESFGSQELADKTTGVGLSLPMGPVLQEWTSDERFFQGGLEQSVVNGATGWDVSGGRLGYAWSYMAGDIAEVLVYNTVLSDTDRQGVENYLNGKYAVLTPPPAPVISPAGGTYPGSVTVTLSTPALGTQLYYTTDGSQPTTNSTLYAVPFNLSSNATVTAVSYLNGMASATTNADFAVTAGSAPTAAAGLAFWFRADVGVITDGSGNVSQWLDESGNGNHASQTVMAAEPVLATNAINGEPVVRFNGTSDCLSFPAVNTTNFTVFIVYRMTGHQAWAGPLENRAAGLYGFEVASGSADTSVYEPELVESLGSQELADITTGVATSLPLGPVLQEWTSDERFFQDGLDQAVVNGATGWDVSGGRLGYAWSYMAGDIAEVLVYNTVLSDTDRQGVENYLNGKYFNPGNPNDYYNGNLPNITIIGGNNQSGLTNSWLPTPLTVQLTDTNALILTNAPVTFAVTQGSALIANSINGTTTNVLQIVTDLNGQAAVWLQLPPTIGTNIVTVSAQSGTNVVQVTFAETAEAVGSLPVMTAVGGERIMELTANGDVVSWGGNQFGELGDYTHVDSINPVHVVGLTNVVKVSSGLSHSLAIDTNGALWAWGDDTYGQLGDGNENTNSNVPLMVSGMSNSVAIAAGSYETSAAVKSDGTVWTWGTTQINPIENPVTNDVPAEVAGLTNAIAVAAGEYHFLVLLNDGTVWAWGQDDSGQLGNGNIGNYSVTPVQVTGLSNIVAICSGSQHNLALDTNGCVWAWGDNSYGELGDGGAEYASATPIAVLTNITQIAAGYFHSLALDALGNLWAWGNDNAGQLGDAGFLNVASASIRPSVFNGQGMWNDNAVQMDDFGLLSWSGSMSLPAQVLAFTNLVSIAAGSDATVVVDSSGNAWQCGSGDTDNADWSWEAPNGVPQLSPVYVDFYDGQLPNEQILGGNNQLGHGGMEFAQPMLFQLTDTNGVALSDAPVSVEVIYGDMELRTNSGGNNYKGLRLVTDTNGEVAVIGYADVNLVNTNCLVRVLAASQAQIAEIDFNETLIASPTLNILSPANGSTILLETNEALGITVDAEAASGLSIQQVDYSYGTNGVANIPLGVSTASPFAFAWTNAEWWSNAFVGQYTLSAVAVDNSGGQSQPQNVTVTIALDTDGGGLPDYWQMEYFGQIGLDPNSSPDGNGQSLLYDYENGINPTNYYNSSVPVLQITGGNDQAGVYNSFLPVPATVYVTDAYGNILTNAPIEFTVTNGIALVEGSTSDVPTNSVVLRTGTDGLVSAWIYFPASNENPPDSTILATAISGNNSVSVSFNEFVPMGYWTFDNTNTWVGEEGQLPLLATNIVGVPDWSSNGVSIDSTNEAVLDYNVVETNGETNICLDNGSILFWFQPAWSSANAAGTGPGHWARLLEVGNYNPAFTNGWWGLSVSPDGSELTFGTSTNGAGEINLSGGISWTAGEWYQIALTYSETNSALYVDGNLIGSGSGVSNLPNANEETNGFRIGSDDNGFKQAGGVFDNLETFNYPLAAADVVTFSSGIPDWWQLHYFGNLTRSALSLDYQQNTLLFDYNYGFDPDTLDFTLGTTNTYVSSTNFSAQVSVQTGVAFYEAVLVNDTNFDDAIWQPFNSTNVTASLGPTDGNYDVWVGLRGRLTTSAPSWHGITFVLDRVAPTIVVTNPTVPTVSRPVLQLQGYVSETTQIFTYDLTNSAGTLNGQPVYLTGVYQDTNIWQFTTNYFQAYDVVLVEGANTITLHATDLAGNTTTTNFTVTLDTSLATNPPVISVAWPANNSSVAGTNFTLQGSVDDPTALVSVNVGTNVFTGVVQRNGLFSVTNLPLSIGTSYFVISATNSGGYSSTQTIAVVQGSVNVTVNPVSSTSLSQQSITVTGTTSEADQDIYVNGVQATINADLTWEADSVPVVNNSGNGTLAVNLYPPGSNPSSTSPTAQQFQLIDMPPSVIPVSFIGNDSFIDSASGIGQIASFNDDELWNQGSGGNANESLVSLINDFGPLTAMWNYPVVWPLGKPWVHMSSGYNGVCTEFIPPGNQPVSPFYQYTRSDQRHADTSVQLIAGLGPQGTTKLIHLKVSAFAYSPSQEYQFNNIDSFYYTPPFDELGSAPVPPSEVQVLGQTLTPTATNEDVGETFISVPAGSSLNVQISLIGTDSQNYTFNVEADEVSLQMAVDNNRDGQISLTGQDQTTVSSPYRFWINDSEENGSIVDSSLSQVPGASDPNYAIKQVEGLSDVVNYFPVELCLGDALSVMPPAQGYEYRLRQGDAAVNFIYTDLLPNNAFDYLTNSTAVDHYGIDPGSYGPMAFSDLDAASVESVDSIFGTDLNTNYLSVVQNNGGNGIILVEGTYSTTKPLWLEIWRNNKLLGGVPLYLDISGVEQMYRQKNLRDGGDPDLPTNLNGDLAVRNSDPGMPTQMGEPSNSDDTLSNGKWFIFTVGSNVGGASARGWESEVFKRLYWSGNRCKFVGVSWYGDPYTNSESVYDYHLAVQNAFITAPSLATFVNSLSGQKTIAGHSLGCGLISSAIADQSMQVSNACLIDAAIPMECFDGSLDDNTLAMAPSAWDNYPEDLYASTWHSLFSNDSRTNLTWRLRFTSANNAIYNFYSSTEDALGEYDFDVPSYLLQALIISGGDFQSYVWVYQEKAKGARQYYTPVPGTSIGAFHVGSTYGGWGFNYMDGYLSSYPVWYDVVGGIRMIKTPDEIGTPSSDVLNGSRWNPLFKTGWGAYNLNEPGEVVVNTDSSLFTGPSWILQLFDPILGSAVASNMLQRDQLLAEAIPALSLPVGAHQCFNIPSNKQFDMAQVFANQNNWPRSVNDSGIPNWHHSDMDQIAYPYLYPLYNQLVSISNQ